MNLGELATHIKQAKLRDQYEPSLWQWSELIMYLNEAQSIFARRTHCLVDDESEFTEIVTEPGKAKYTLDPRIIHVIDVVDSTGYSLRNMQRRKFPSRLAEGKPRVYGLDAASRHIRLSPVPDDEYTLHMLVARKPLRRLESEFDEPEIPEEYHLLLCDWVVYKALANNDPEGSNTVAADGFRAEWEVGLLQAKREIYRQRTGENPTAFRRWV